MGIGDIGFIYIFSCFLGFPIQSDLIQNPMDWIWHFYFETRKNLVLTKPEIYLPFAIPIYDGH